MLKIVILSVFAFVSLVLSAVVSVQNWESNKAYQNQSIVIYQSEAYLATQNIPAGNVPNQSNAWKIIAKYSNPGNYKHDSAYVAGDVVKFNIDVFVARHWSSHTRPNKNDQWGAWIFVSNYAPITPPISGPIAKLPPHPGAAGKKTILGIDSDGDGIRDDIQIAVTKLIPDDPYKRAGALFVFAMQQELWKVVLENPNKPFEFYFPHIMGICAGVFYTIETGANNILPVRRREALLLNTRERFLMSQRIDSIASGSVTMGYEDYPDLKEKFDRKFQEIYRRELERQK